MSTDLQSLVRPHLLSMAPYSSARDDFAVAVDGESHKVASSFVFLDANENPYGSWVHDETYMRYPDPYHRLAREKISALYGVPVDQIFLGAGSDESINLLIQAFCSPARENILVFPPTYGMYKVSASIHEVSVETSLLTPTFEIDLISAQEALKRKPKITFICSPNNPTGNCIGLDVIELLTREAPGIVVVDEAYIDYAPTRSALPLLKQYNNLVILKTFSKGWGLAGLRTGIAIADPFIISILHKIKPPYNLSIPQQQLLCEALEGGKRQQEYIDRLIRHRDELQKALLSCRVVEHVYPSDSSFLLVKTVDGPMVFKELLKRGVVVRSRHNEPLCQHCLRISIGTQNENDKLVDGLKNISI